MTKEQEIMNFLSDKVFEPVLCSTTASKELKSGINLTKTRMNQRNAEGMIQYYWSAIVGTERSTKFARMMREEGFTRFEETIDEFRDRFNDEWLVS